MDRCKAGALPLSYTPTELPMVKEGGAVAGIRRPSFTDYSSLERQVSWGRWFYPCVVSYGIKFGPRMLLGNLGLISQEGHHALGDLLSGVLLQVVTCVAH